MSTAIGDFIGHARSKGLDHATIRQLLLTAGWKEKDVARAIAAQELDVPVPEPSGGGSARDSFIYLMCFVSLYVIVSSVIVLFYTFLDNLYPDAAWGYTELEWVLNGVRYAIAAIAVALPLFLILSWVLERIARQSPESRKQSVARWLTYLTMFLAAAILMGDLITLLFYFLDGSLSTRFVLKAVVLLVIAEVILSYYYLTPRSALPGGSSQMLRKALAGAGLAIVAGAIVLGFSLAGSPFTARQTRLDDRRVADLRLIHNAIQQMSTIRVDNQTKLIHPLPTTLEEVAAFQRTLQYNQQLSLSDPQSAEPYSYAVTGEKTYELTATFVLVRDRKTDLFWNHPAGSHTFKFKAESPP